MKHYNTMSNNPTMRYDEQYDDETYESSHYSDENDNQEQNDNNEQTENNEQKAEHYEPQCSDVSDWAFVFLTESTEYTESNIPMYIDSIIRSLYHTTPVIVRLILLFCFFYYLYCGLPY